MIASASDDQTIRVLQLDHQFNPTVKWVGGFTALLFQDAILKGVQGLTTGQRRLIEQRGGIFEQQEDDEEKEE